MLYNTLHNRGLRLLAAIAGELIAAAALNLFIAPLNLYTSGLMGLCQVLRTLMQQYLGLSFGTTDIAGILYFIVNIPIMVLAYKALGREFTGKTVICIVAYSFFYSVIPVPSTPFIDDYLTACLLSGILTGVGLGLVLTCGSSGGGLDIIGLYLSKKGSSFTVGKFSLTFNVVLYAACLVLFSPEVAIYSVIYNFFTVMVMDRMHQQNINIQVLIFTRQDEGALASAIMGKLHRGVTYWTGVGAYTKEDLHVLCVCLSKFEMEDLVHMVHSVDPHAFLMVQEGVRVLGNFTKKLD